VKQVDLNIAWSFQDENEWLEAAKGGGELLYARNTPPSIVQELETVMAAMEYTDTAVTFSSGMAAIFATLFTFAKPGMKVVSLDAVYGGTYSLLTHVLPSWGVDCQLMSYQNSEPFFKAIAEGCDLVYIETPSNPLLIETDIEQVCEAAKAVGAIVVCDNTVATPFAQNPSTLGVDLVIHSATKYLGGHVDALAGIVCCNGQLAKQLMATRELVGSVLPAQSAHLVLRGIQTFELRMERATSNARRLAAWLDQHPGVQKVNYPGLVTDRSDSLKNDVALLSFELADRSRVSAFLSRLKVVGMASTLGSTQTLVGLPETTSHVECTIAERESLGVAGGLIRVSLGIEPFDRLMCDFDRALTSINP